MGGLPHSDAWQLEEGQVPPTAQSLRPTTLTFVAHECQVVYGVHT